MAYCENCGHQLADGAKFCFECGEKISEEQTADVEIPISVVLSNTQIGITRKEVFFQHLNKTIAVNIPNNISVGQKLRLHGLGRTNNYGQTGDAYILIAYIDRKEPKRAEEPSQRKVNYEGEVRKCPQCGDVIDAYELYCEACGFEIRGRKTTSVVHELSLKLEKTDTSQNKDELIRNFYIPNTKEDIHEFFILALSNIKIGGMNTDAWMVKLEQAYQKAELSFGNSNEFERLKTLYEKAQSMNRVNKTVGFLKGVGRCFKSGYAWALLFAAIGGCMWAISGDFESTTSIVGMFGVVGGMWIAIMTMINNDSKKQK